MPVRLLATSGVKALSTVARMRGTSTSWPGHARAALAAALTASSFILMLIGPTDTLSIRLRRIATARSTRAMHHTTRFIAELTALAASK